MIVELILAIAAVQATPAAPAAEKMTREELRQRSEQCHGRKLEISAGARINGKMERTKLVLCGDKGESNAQWLARLEKAVAEVKAQKGMNPDMEKQLLRGLEKEIDKARSAG